MGGERTRGRGATPASMLAVVVALGTALGACGESDETAPPRPSPTSATTTATRDRASSNILGVFVAGARPENVARFEDTFGVSVQYVLDFTGGASMRAREPWAKIDSPEARCTPWVGTGRDLILSTAMLPNRRFTLEEGAAGRYDVHWQRFGEALVSAGCPDAVLRLGWELNGRYYAWAAAGRERAFASYWRRIVTVLRRVPGQRFRFDWSVLSGVRGTDLDLAWPGDDVVDYVGLDAYDASPVRPPDDRWTDQLTRRPGLQWHAEFAAAHRKPMSFPEWGVTVRPDDDLGGGDNPQYVARMAQWFLTHDVAYAVYFDVDARDAAHRISGDRFPMARAEFLAVAPALAGVPSRADGRG